MIRRSTKIEENDSSMICYAFETVFISIVSLSFGIAEAVILSANKEAKNACGDGIWYCVLVLCILHFCNIIAEICRLSSDEKNISSLPFIILAINIWGVVAYYDIDDKCHTVYVDKYPDLLNMLYAEVITSFIAFGICGVYCCCGCFSLCFTMFGNMDDAKPNMQQAIEQAKKELEYSPNVHSTQPPLIRQNSKVGENIV